MLYANDFRSIARNGLRNRWGLAIGTGFIAGILGAYTQNGFSFDFRKEYNSSSYYNDWGYNGYSSLNIEVFSIILTILGIIAIYSLAILIISGAIKIGYCRFNLKIVDGEYASLNDLFSAFNIFGKALLMNILLNIYITLWSLLFIIPGIVKSYSYAMTPYILAENPYMGVNEAITVSRKMMNGNKARLFCLDWSFFGWGILCILSFGIGFLWLVPYMHASHAAFFNEVSGRGFAREMNQQGGPGPDFQNGAYQG